MSLFLPSLHYTLSSPWSHQARVSKVPGIRGRNYFWFSVLQLPICSCFMNNLSHLSSPSTAPLGVHTIGVMNVPGIGYILLNVCQVCSRPVSIWRSFMDSFPLDFLPCTTPPAPLGVRTRGVWMCQVLGMFCWMCVRCVPNLCQYGAVLWTRSHWISSPALHLLHPLESAPEGFECAGYRTESIFC